MSEEIKNIEETQSVVKELVAKHTPKVDETKKDIQTDDSAQTTTDDSKLEDSLITEELAEQMGIPKGFIGRPLSEIGKSYKESVNWGNTNNQELIQLKTDLENLKGQVSQTQLKKAEEDAKKDADIQTENLLGEIPDPLEDPNGFNEWLLKRDSLITDSLKKEFRKELKEESDKIKEDFQNNPTLKKAEEMALQKTVSLVFDDIQGGLPNDVGAGDVFDAWLEDNKDVADSFLKEGFYKDRPEKLVKDVLNWFKAQSYDSLKNQKESDIIKTIHKKTKENLERANKTTPSVPSVVINIDEKPEGLVSKMVENLRRRSGLTGD